MTNAAGRMRLVPRRLLAGVAVETGLGALVLGAAAILGMTAPPS